MVALSQPKAPGFQKPSGGSLDHSRSVLWKHLQNACLFSPHFQSNWDWKGQIREAWPTLSPSGQCPGGGATVLLDTTGVNGYPPPA